MNKQNEPAKGRLLVVSGPSGVGKGTVLAELLKRSDDYAYSVSATTRARRQGEIDGKNYFFKTRGEFEKMTKRECFSNMPNTTEITTERRKNS